MNKEQVEFLREMDGHDLYAPARLEELFNVPPSMFDRYLFAFVEDGGSGFGKDGWTRVPASYFVTELLRKMGLECLGQDLQYSSSRSEPTRTIARLIGTLADAQCWNRK
jgi:hypothetical protein